MQGKMAKQVLVATQGLVPTQSLVPTQGLLLPAWQGATYHEHQETGVLWMLEREAKGYTIPGLPGP